jgi:hypothetical protein
MWRYVVELQWPLSQLDLLMRSGSKTPPPTCPVDEGFVSAVLERNGRDELTALAATYRLLRALPALPTTPDELQRGLRAKP